MSKLVEIGRTDELKEGAMKKVLSEGQEILLARVGNKYYATANHCPHMGGKLAEGELEGTIVTCPRHGSQFDLRNGRVVRWLKGSGLTSRVGKILKSPRPIATYHVKVENDRISLEI
jgi:3-phenylpropionate/trans-cinnamate dioxygenase ferredoxin subunit